MYSTNLFRIHKISKIFRTSNIQRRTTTSQLGAANGRANHPRTNSSHVRTSDGEATSNQPMWTTPPKEGTKMKEQEPPIRCLGITRTNGQKVPIGGVWVDQFGRRSRHRAGTIFPPLPKADRTGSRRAVRTLERSPDGQKKPFHLVERRKGKNKTYFC